VAATNLLEQLKSEQLELQPLVLKQANDQKKKTLVLTKQLQKQLTEIGYSQS